MKLSNEMRNEIMSALDSRLKEAACQLCRKNSWTLADGFVPLGLQEDFSTFQVGGPVLPLVALVCSNCGNTCFINLISLGLRHLAETPQMQAK